MKTPEASDGHQLLRPPLYSPPPPSFLDVVQGKHLQSHANLHPYAKTSSESVQPHANLRSSALASGESAHSVLAREGLHHSRKPALKPVSSFKDKPCVAFSISEVKALEDNCKFALIGKFSHGRPSFTSIRTFLVNLQLEGPFNLANLDKKHVLIECSCYADFYGLWLKLVCYIDGFAMRVFKWEPSYTPAKESAMAPVWIRIEGLPLHMFDEMPLRSIANSIGKPIKIDPRNINRTLVNCARICVELDVSKQLVDVIRLSLVDDVTGVEVEGRWLQVFYDVVPKYCVPCCHIGHGTVDCKRAEPLPPVTTSRAQTYTQVWLPADQKNGSELMQGCSSGAANADHADQIASGQKRSWAEPAEAEQLHPLSKQLAKNGAAAVPAAIRNGTPPKSADSPQTQDQITEQFGNLGCSSVANADQEHAGQNSARSAGKRSWAQPAEADQNADSLQQEADTASVDKGTCSSGEAVHQVEQTASGEPVHVAPAAQPKEGTHQVEQAAVAETSGTAAQDAPASQQAGQIEGRTQHSSKTNTTDQVAETSDTTCKHYRSVQKDGKNECTTLVAWTAAAATDQATPLHLQESQVIGKLSWADQAELEQDQVTANSWSKDHYMALEHTFELHTEKEQGAYGNLLCVPIPEFYDLSPQEQKEDTSIIMAEFYLYSVRNALEEEIEKDSKDNRAAPDSEHLPTEHEWQTVTGKKKRTTKVKADQKGYQSCQMVDTRIESLCARINKMKRDCPAKRKLLAELEDLNQLHFEDGA